MKINKFDSFFFRSYRFISKNERWLMALLSGFLLGRITNELSVPYPTWRDFLSGLFSVADRPANILTWLSLLLLLAIPLGKYILAKYHKSRQYEEIFASISKKYKDSSITRFNTIGWHSALSLQTCPELNRGWQASDVRLSHNAIRFSLPDKYKLPYQEYLEKYHKEKRFFDNGVKIMLTRNPIVFSDSPTLMLETQEAFFSQNQFYCDNIAASSPERDKLICEVCDNDEPSVSFPHSLCMHIVIVTNDDKVLITKRSQKVAESYSRGKWSCSIEEQMSIKDIEGDSNNIVLRWFERALNEELALTSEEYNKDNLRILSVFLESNILNISVCAYAVLDISSTELDQILIDRPRKDYEFDKWEFFTHKKLLEELFHPTMSYHPTSGYRMLMALIKRYGEPKLAIEFSLKDKK